jgi:hypothetical protein
MSATCGEPVFVKRRVYVMAHFCGRPAKYEVEVDGSFMASPRLVCGIHVRPYRRIEAKVVAV